MVTINIYENSTTSNLKELLLNLEKDSERNEIILDYAKSINEDWSEFKKKRDDYDIDISLIRMELTKRIWNENE
jgi:hypothetical protein